MVWFFNKKDSNNYGAALEERVEEKFSRLKKCRFKNEASDSYSAEIRKHELKFRLFRKNVFAWCESSFQSCADFSAEADFSFTDEKSYSSAGIIFRKGSDFNYYYFLVSNRGFFRVDCVFNGKPMPLIEWTPLSTAVGKDISIKVVGLGGYFNFHINGEKICSLHDEIIGKGDITFCCQNYDASDSAEITLKRFLVNTVSFDVESEYSEENEISTDQKFNLAKSLYERRKYEPAAVWMENIIRSSANKKIPASVFSLYGEILLNIGLYDDALRCFDRAISQDPDNVLLILEKGNLLYQQGRYLDLLDFLEENKETCSSNSVYYDLKGHSAYYLGREADALDNYLKAAEFDPENPVYFYNAGKCSEKDNIEKAAECYTKALVLFFRQDSVEDVQNLLSWFDESGLSDSLVESIKGKVLFNKNDFKNAEEIFKKLIKTDKAESDIYYLYSLILYRDGSVEESIKNLEKCCSLEPDFPLYFFRLAEFRFAASLDPSDAIEKAVKLSPEDEWINNLAGLISLNKGNISRSAEYFKAAYSSNKDSRIVLNYSEALLQSGNYEKALEILDSVEKSPESIIKKGSIYSASGQYSKAYDILESAYRDDPDNNDIMKSLAEASYLDGKLSRSEEILYQLEAKAPDSSVYNMIGNAAKFKGEFLRAEAAYLKSLELDFNPVVALNYIEGICEKQDFTAAYGKMNELFDNYEVPGSLNERFSRIKNRILREAELTLSCASCSREWKVLKKTVMKKALKIVGEPSPESPAGRCPSCGKIYCVECAMKWLEGSRFTCPDCSEYLKLNDDHLRFLVAKYAAESQLS